jgi:hypothetical protein
MKKIPLIFLVLLLTVCIELNNIARAEEWDWTGNDNTAGSQNEGSQLMNYFVIVLVIIIGIVILIAVRMADRITKKQNPHQLILQSSSFYDSIIKQSKKVFGKQFVCSKCGKPIHKQFKFCPYCNNKLIKI